MLRVRAQVRLWVFLGVLAGMAGGTADALAQTSIWDGSESTNWFEPLNWGSGNIPNNASRPATIDTITPRMTVINQAGGQALGLGIGSASGTTGNLTVTGAGRLSTGGNGQYVFIGGSGNGTLTVEAGGQVTVNAATQTYVAEGTGGAGVGLLTVTGTGSLYAANGGLYISTDANANGEVNVSNGGQVTAAVIGISNFGGDATSSGRIIVDGVGSNVTSSTSTTIGPFGSGSITVRNGGTFNTSTLVLAAGAGRTGSLLVQSGGDFIAGSTVTIGQAGTGTATINGIGSTLSSTAASLIVGDGATGTLNVEAGAVVSSKNVRIGDDAGVSGTATVTGAGSQWNLTETLEVGVLGSGTLNILDGATMTAERVYIGKDDGVGSITATGAMKVSGTGSKLTVIGATSGSNLSIGLATNAPGVSGSLSIENGGAVVIGDSAQFGALFGNSATALTVTGANSTLTINRSTTIRGSLRLGFTGTSTMDVTSGGRVVLDTSDFTAASGASVAVVVDGATTTWSSEAITIGGAGTSSFTVRNGAQVTNGTGNITIDGTNTTVPILTVTSSGGVTSSGTVNVGNSNGGKGALTINGGGDLSAAGLSFGGTAGSTATVNVSGTGSTLKSTGFFNVGTSGTATLNVSDGATVTSAGASIGQFSTGSGTVTLSGTGTAWNASGVDITSIGVGANSSLTLETGASMTITGVSLPGELQVNGGFIARNAGTVLNADLYVGNADGVTSTAQILSGALVSSKNGVIGVHGTIGTGAGVVTVDGANSRWTMTGDLDVGERAVGTINIQNNGTVTAQNLDVGTYIPTVTECGCGGTTVGGRGDGTVNVTATGALLTVNGTARIGVYGDGELNITAGGDMTSGAAIIGAEAGGIGTATVTGAGSTWQNTGTFAIGMNGTGTLTVTADGAVTSTGAASIGTGSTLHIGTGTTAGSFSAASLANAGTLHFNHTGSVTFGTAISGAGVLTKDAAGTTILSADNTMTGTTTINAGALQLGNGGTTGALAGNVVDNGLLSVNRSNALTLSGNISGSGGFRQFGTGTTTFTGTNSYLGATAVDVGRLNINGTLSNSTVTVASGATIGGNGIANVINVLAGGIFAPGNSIDEMEVATVSFSNGSFFDVEINPTASDLLTVTGTATVNAGAVVRVAVEDPGTYTPGSEWKILDAFALNGGFSAGVIDDSAFLNFTLDQTTRANEVWLQLAGVSSFVPVGQTPNQIAAATALESLGTNHPLVAPILPLNAAEALVAFDQLSGEVHAAVARALIEDSRLPREAALDRIDAAFDAIASSNEAFWSRELWARAVGTGGVVAGDGNAAAVGYGAAGLIVGADGRIGEHLFVGFEGGFTQHAIGVVDRSSTASASGYHFGMYGGAAFEALRVKFGAAWSGYGVSTTRTPTFPGFTETLNTSYLAGTAQAFAELGYAFELEAMTLEPFVRGALLHHSAMGYAEAGGSAALSGNVDTNLSGLITIGVRAETEIALGDELVAKATGMIGVQHQAGAAPTATHAFDGSSPFTVSAPGFGTGVVAEAGLSIDLSAQSSLSLMARGSLSGGAATGGVSATFSGKF